MTVFSLIPPNMRANVKTACGRCEPLERITSMTVLLDEAINHKVFALSESAIRSDRSRCPRPNGLAVQVRTKSAGAYAGVRDQVVWQHDQPKLWSFSPADQCLAQVIAERQLIGKDRPLAEFHVARKLPCNDAITGVILRLCSLA